MTRDRIAKPGSGGRLGIAAPDVTAMIVVLAPGVAFVIPGLLSEYALELGFRVMVYLVLAEAWNLLAGYGGLVSLGTASFVGLGAYILVGLLNHSSAPLPLVLLAAAAAGAGMAAIISPAVFRLRGLYFTVGTLALAEVLRLLMVNVPFFGGATGLFLGVDWASSRALYLWALALLAVAELLVTLCTRTRWSILLRAVRDDEDAAAQVGVRAFRVKLVAFAVASALMSAAGALQAYKVGAVEPYGMFGLAWSIDVLAIVMIGGLGFRAGAAMGTVFVLILAELTADYPELHVAITGAILIAIIRFAPQGLCGFAGNLATRLRRTPQRALP
jgi:branched-chain amino acid transport system permease protein